LPDGKVSVWVIKNELKNPRRQIDDYHGHNVYVKVIYDRLRINKALKNFRKSYNNENKNNVCSAW